MNIECKMPTKAYLRKFAYWSENIPSTTESIISLKSNSIIANLISLHLVGKKALSERDYSWVHKEYNDELRFRIYNHNVDRGKLFLTAKSTYVINKTLHDLFLEIALNRAVFQKRIGVNFRDTIRDFCEEIGIEIEIDIPFQTLIKQFASRPSARQSMLV